MIIVRGLLSIKVHWYCQSKLVLTLFIYATMINLILSTLTTKQVGLWLDVEGISFWP